MVLSEALILALIAGLAGVDYFMEVFQIYRPLVLGTIIGLVMGDLTTGLFIGATFELMWMGLMPIGGAQPPNMVIGTVLGTVFAIATGQGAATAIGIGIPFAILMQGVITLLYTAYAVLMQKSDKYAETGNLSGIGKIQFGSLGIVFVLYFLVAFLPIFFGIDKAMVIISLMPDWLMGGLEVAGGVMPAIGFAMLLKIMFKSDYVIYLILGFIMVTYLYLPIIAIAGIGACMAVYNFGINKDNNGQQRMESEGGFTDGI